MSLKWIWNALTLIQACKIQKDNGTIGGGREKALMKAFILLGTQGILAVQQKLSANGEKNRKRCLRLQESLRSWSGLEVCAEPLWVASSKLAHFPWQQSFLCVLICPGLLPVICPRIVSSGTARKCKPCLAKRERCSSVERCLPACCRSETTAVVEDGGVMIGLVAPYCEWLSR